MRIVYTNNENTWSTKERKYKQQVTCRDHAGMVRTGRHAGIHMPLYIDTVDDIYDLLEHITLTLIGISRLYDVQTLIFALTMVNGILN